MEVIYIFSDGDGGCDNGGGDGGCGSCGGMRFYGHFKLYKTCIQIYQNIRSNPWSDYRLAMF